MVCGISKDAADSDSITTGTIEGDENSSDSNDSKTEEKGFPWLIVIIVVVVLVLAGGGVLVYIYREKIWPKEITENDN